MRTHRNVLLPVSANPMEIYLLGLCVVSGASGLAELLTGTQSTRSNWFDAIWYLLLLVGGVVAIVGNYWPDTLTGMLMVRAAMWPIGCGAAIYTVIVAYNRLWSLSVAVFMFGIAALFRAHGINRQLRDLTTSRHE